MRIRLPFAGAFATLVLLAAYLGLSSHASTPPESDPTQPPPSSSIPSSPTLPINDKVLHFLAFFLLTITFYWILDTSRRRVLNLTLISITVGLGIGSEFLQEFIPNGRNFDVYDIVANVVGSLCALGGCSWYHMRMLERKRARRGYGLVATADGDEGLEQDLELGNLGAGVGAQESGEIVASGATGVNLEEEVDNWDENLDDGWDVDVDGDETTDHEGGLKTPSASSAGEGEPEGKKRSD